MQGTDAMQISQSFTSRTELVAVNASPQLSSLHHALPHADLTRSVLTSRCTSGSIDSDACLSDLHYCSSVACDACVPLVMNGLILSGHKLAALLQLCALLLLPLLCNSGLLLCSHQLGLVGSPHLLGTVLCCSTHLHPSSLDTKTGHFTHEEQKQCKNQVVARCNNGS